ncbi:MAG: short-chain dehydrogenase/reductase [Conexibacter sp.]|nr:short-chain dehydrogenase/reductase [Conexibacter sp.]
MTSSNGRGRLEDRIAIVTGSAQGLGAAIARLFAAEGAAVLVTDISAEQGQATAASLAEAGGRAAFQKLDVTSEDDWAAAVDRTTTEFGSAPDVLVNNAFMWAPGTLTGVAVEDWNRGLLVNLSGPFLGMRAVIPGMQAAGRGAIVNIGSSMGGEVAAPDFAGYQAAKGGLRSLTRHVAVTYAADGIRANLVHPGPMYTDGMRQVDFVGPMEQIASGFPIARVGQPEEVAYSALFLASDESSYITGTALVPDGGSSIGL